MHGLTARRTFTFLGAVAILASLVVGVPARAGSDFRLSPKIGAHATGHKMLVFRISYHDPSLPFAAPIRAGIEDAARDLHVDAKMVGPAGGAADKQVAELQDLLVQNIDGVGVSSATTDALAPLINKAIGDGVPVVTFNTDNPKSHRLAFVGQDLVQSGRIAGEQMGRLLGGKGHVLIYSLDAAAQWSHDRESGAREALAKYPGINVVGLISANNNTESTYSVIQNAMTGHPDVDGIVALDCCSFPAAAQYVQRSHLIGKVKVVGFDLLPLNLEMVQNGAAQVTIGQNPYEQGYDTVKLLYSAAQGKPVQSIDTGTQIVTKTNVNQVMHDAKAGKVG